MDTFSYHRTVIAYHGCDQEVRDQVLTGSGSLRTSENRYDWLGRGIYFWEFGPRRALDWARRRAAEGSTSIRRPAVLGAVIHLGRCFGLLDMGNTALLAELHPAFERFLGETGSTMPMNRAPRGGDPHELILRELDCAMINWCLSRLEEGGLAFDSVRCAFSEGGEAFPGSRILERTFSPMKPLSKSLRPDPSTRFISQRAAIYAKVIEETREMTRDQLRASFQRAGILTPTGRFARPYRALGRRLADS